MLDFKCDILYGWAAVMLGANYTQNSNLRFQHRSVRNRSPKSRPKSTNSALLVLTSVCSGRKFEPLMLNSLLSTWPKSSHKHWTIPRQRSPHLLYMYKTRAILAVWLYSDARNILTIDANFTQTILGSQKILTSKHTSLLLDPITQKTRLEQKALFRKYKYKPRDKYYR